MHSRPIIRITVAAIVSFLLIVGIIVLSMYMAKKAPPTPQLTVVEPTIPEPAIPPSPVEPQQDVTELAVSGEPEETTQLDNILDDTLPEYTILPDPSNDNELRHLDLTDRSQGQYVPSYRDTFDTLPNLGAGKIVPIMKKEICCDDNEMDEYTF
jgi:hypothetical protein